MLLRSRLRLRSRIFIFLAISSFLVWNSLPYDHGLVLFIRWHSNTISTAMTAKDSWLSEPPAFPLDMDHVGIIVKTGFSTRDRLLARLDAFEDARDKSNLVLVGDYATAPGAHFSHNGLKLPVYDALAWMIESGSLSSQPTAPRLLYHSNLTAALASGDTDLARSIGEAHGWELDIMKHVSGLELGYKWMPHKKWYIMLDDDSYVLNPSLQTVLGHLDPLVPYYLGNAGGDYKGRFAHGGSAVILSQAAMHRLFTRNPEVVAAAHLESLEASSGDKLIATTAMKTGVYLKERYNRHFNAERPRATRIREDRFCIPIVSFHKVSPSQMLDAGTTFKDAAGAVSWIDLWKIYKAPQFNKFLAEPIRVNWDHVGPLDDTVKTTNKVKTEGQCHEICRNQGSSCLAWTWERKTMACHISPWMTVGEASDDKFSGVNGRRVLQLLEECPQKEDVSASHGGNITSRHVKMRGHSHLR